MALSAAGTNAVTSPTYDAVYNATLTTYTIAALGPYADVRPNPPSWLTFQRDRGYYDDLLGYPPAVNSIEYNYRWSATSSTTFQLNSAVRSTALPTVNDTGFSLNWQGGACDQVIVKLRVPTTYPNSGDTKFLPLAIPITWTGGAPPAWSCEDALDTLLMGSSFGVGASAPTVANLLAASQVPVGYIREYTGRIDLQVFAGKWRPIPGGGLGLRYVDLYRATNGAPSATGYRNRFWRQDGTFWFGAIGALLNHYNTKGAIPITCHGVSATTTPPNVTVTIPYLTLDGDATRYATVTVAASAITVKYGTCAWRAAFTVNPYAAIPAGTLWAGGMSTSASDGSMASSIIADKMSPDFPPGWTTDEIPGSAVMAGRLIQMTA